MSNKRKRKEEEEDGRRPQVKKQKVGPVNAEQQKLKSVYVVMTQKGDEGTGSDYEYDERLPDSYDTEVIGVYASRTKANQAAEEYFKELEDEEMETIDIYSQSQNGLFCKTRATQDDGYSRFGGTIVNVKVW
eukprot:CAMPEP_0202710176 /NCGR_PEP_ID=MMETSP1385-20130828/22192_1 /ASSEMBLY_ACC=CAM_ASM_000861 /TAXON_ID=933848 /ORGANISM="Elphidium margaritaceum" /LENGTH=131 /DNA_ID=CAMNT_0049369639 /DNA_START=28 /DNA_END=420 /DNA_ORIENTATION=+